MSSITTFTCDRCGVTEQAQKSGPSMSRAYAPAWADVHIDWDERSDLCSNCAQDFRKMFKKFREGPTVT